MKANKKPEEQAREKIDEQLRAVGWDIVSRDEYVPGNTVAVMEALMQGSKESDYLLFVDNKAIAVIEAKRAENTLKEDVAQQAENYANTPQKWYGLWFDGLIPLVYMANGKKIYFKNLFKDPNGEYEEIKTFHSPKKMLRLIDKDSAFGALPYLDKKGFRDCQYNAEIQLEKSLKKGLLRFLAILATGAGKTFLACLTTYRLLNYTDTKRVLFLVDRNNLSKQAESEFSLFRRTETGEPMSDLYSIKRLRKNDDINADIVISTIQKLFAVLTGQQLIETNEDAEDEEAAQVEALDTDNEVKLGKDLKLPPDYFQFIVVDECHRSIYGKWKAVLDYFAEAKILGLTATPTPEAEGFFNKNVIANYTYEKSVTDGVNVSAKVYRISTKTTEQGGTIASGSEVIENAKGKKNTKGSVKYVVHKSVKYDALELDRTVTDRGQIRKVLEAYRDSIYTELYPNRPENWAYVPKTLIFAKDDRHATEIVSMVEEVFGEKFDDGKVPKHFVQKITYSAGDSNGLIRELRTDKAFRIAVTVTLVATGTDVKPLEVVFFMRDIMSDVLYTQMKGRGCRTISDDKLREVTPNADTKECYYIVDAVGVTEHEKNIPMGSCGGSGGNFLTLEQLLERLAHGEVSDENLMSLNNQCAAIHARYENNQFFSHHLESFVENYGFSPRELAANIQKAIDNKELGEYQGVSGDNHRRQELIDCLISNIPARLKLLEMKRGYQLVTEGKDELIYVGFSKKDAGDYIANFENYLEKNKDSIEALRIVYNSRDITITNEMLVELRERLLAENRNYQGEIIWRNYKVLDKEGRVKELETVHAKALTNLIQIVRFAYGKTPQLTSLIVGYSKRFSLYCGQNQRILTPAQVEVMRQIAEYIIKDGAISPRELNEYDPELWKRGINTLTPQKLKEEMQNLASFILTIA